MDNFLRHHARRVCGPLSIVIALTCTGTPALAGYSGWRQYLLGLGNTLSDGADEAAQEPELTAGDSEDGAQEHAPKTPHGKEGAEVLDEIDGMVGLESVKRLLVVSYRQGTLALQSPDKARRAMHLAFVGPAGSGKTEVARIYARALHAAGLSKRAEPLFVTRGDLVGQYLGETPGKSRSYLNKGRGGVIVIDHVGELIERSENRGHNYGGEALAVIRKAMEDWSADTVFILADKKPALDALASDDSNVMQRVTQSVAFATLDARQLEVVLQRAAEKAGYGFDDKVLPFVRPQLASVARRENGGGAAKVHQMLDNAIMHWQVRQVEQTDLQAVLTVGDFDPSQSAANLRTVDERIARATAVLDRLQDMPGMETIYEQLHGILLSLAFDLMTNDGRPAAHRGLHMAFVGPPGTGKTTVAQLFSECLKELGILRTDTFLSRRPADFLSQGGGRTAEKAREALEEGRGGITFIDEAYGLVSHHEGAQALEQLLLFMEEEREDSIVILAGYEADMDHLYSFNPGFRRRISETVVFPTYDAESLMKIFLSFLKREQFTLAPDMYEKMHAYFEAERRGRDFGNAGAVRGVSERAIAAWKVRYVQVRMRGGSAAEELPREITAEDLKCVFGKCKEVN